MIQLLNNALWQQKKYVIADVKHQAIRSLVFSPLIGLLSPPFARLFNQAYFEVTFFAFQTDAGTTKVPATGCKASDTNLLAVLITTLIKSKCQSGLPQVCPCLAYIK